MTKIKPLSQSLISKIAAGEVIERPVYAVKELVENALDAGSDSIKVIVDESGLKRITVIDNGEGMTKEDLEECFKPHTTSKLNSENDLHAIQTLGFRGEALSSIAAISTLTIASRHKDAPSGNLLKVVEGAAEKIVPFGMPVGTHVTVENLFGPVPARKKFLKSMRTEFRHIIDTLMHFAFSHPSVQMTLVHNGKTIFDLPKTNDVLLRVQVLLEKDIFANMMPILFEDSYITVRGFLARPQITAKTPDKQFLFVNNRKIWDKGISQMMKSAYGTLLEKQAYPVAILFLQMPHEMLDVNVHPRKEEVKFVDTKIVLSAIENAVVQTITQNKLFFAASSWQNAAFLGDGDAPFMGRSTHTYAGKLLKEQQLPWTLLQSPSLDVSKVMQMHNLYIVSPTKDGFFLVDQHAAHERIMFEQFSRAFEEQKAQQEMYTFTKPKVVEFSLSESDLLQEYESHFVSLGFAIEHFKGKSFLIRSVPQLFKDRDQKDLISDILKNLRIDKTDGSDSFSKRMLAFLACRSAVKAGDVLSEEQCRDLLLQLEKTPNNATCPHGRPTKVLVDLDMIHKLFKR